MLHAYRKSNGEYFPCHPKAICHEWNGDIIDNFLTNSNLLGEYRKIFEPMWKPAMEELKAGRISPNDKMVAAGYWANLLLCTPAWRRVGIKSHSQSTLHTIRAIDALNTNKGKPDWKIKEALAAIDAGFIRLETDPDFIRAWYTERLIKYAWSLYNSDWLILKNNTTTEFLTSDNPVSFNDPGCRVSPHPRMPRYLTVSPFICLYCDLSLRPKTPNISELDFALPPQGKISSITINHRDVSRVNRIIVQCAEDLVISPSKNSSIEALVNKYAKYQIDVDFINISKPNEYIFGMQIRVRESLRK